MNVRAIDCADYMTELSCREDCPIGTFQMQSMLFLAQCEYMRSHDGRRLFVDDTFAWNYGAVVPVVYAAYARFGGDWVSRRGGSVPFDADAFARRLHASDPDRLAVLDGTFEAWAHTSPWKLAAKVRRPGGVWDRVYHRHGRAAVDVIEDADIMCDDAVPSLADEPAGKTEPDGKGPDILV